MADPQEAGTHQRTELDPRSASHEGPPPPPPPPPEDGAGVERQQPKQEHHRKHSFWKELPVLVVIAFAVALLIKSFLLQAFFIPSASMEAILQVGDRVLVEKVTKHFGDPTRGDVVVFERAFGSEIEEEGRGVGERIADAFRGLFGFPTGGEQDFIKRVIAVGGDSVESRDGRVFLNGEPLDEPYLADGTETSSFGPLEIPEGQIFMMGDNRGNSDDSRSFGPISVDEVVGRAFVVIWPPSHLGGL